jgi:hypothetical protein
VDTGVGDNNSDGVFDGDDPDAADDDGFDYQELLCHVKPWVLSSIGTQRGLSNMDILEKSSADVFVQQIKWLWRRIYSVTCRERTSKVEGQPWIV